MSILSNKYSSYSVFNNILFRCGLILEYEFPDSFYAALEKTTKLRLLEYVLFLLTLCSLSVLSRVGSIRKPSVSRKLIETLSATPSSVEQLQYLYNIIINILFTFVSSFDDCGEFDKKLVLNALKTSVSTGALWAGIE